MNRINMNDPKVKESIYKLSLVLEEQLKRLTREGYFHKYENNKSIILDEHGKITF